MLKDAINANQEVLINNVRMEQQAWNTAIREGLELLVYIVDENQRIYQMNEQMRLDALVELPDLFDGVSRTLDYLTLPVTIVGLFIDAPLFGIYVFLSSLYVFDMRLISDYKRIRRSMEEMGDK